MDKKKIYNFKDQELLEDPNTSSVLKKDNTQSIERSMNFSISEYKNLKKNPTIVLSKFKKLYRYGFKILRLEPTRSNHRFFEMSSL